MPLDSSPPVFLRLLDGFDLQVDGASLHVSMPAQRLLAFVALQLRPPTRRMVMAALWPDLGESQGAARLRSTLWRMPKVDLVSLVQTDCHRVSLSPGVEVDVLLAQDGTRVDQLDVEELRGEVLAEWSDDWVVIERERFRQLHLRRLEHLSDLALAQHDFDFALRACLVAVAIEPLRESAHRRVMQVHLAEHNPAEALRQYDVVRTSLRLELGLAPSAATRSMVAGLLGRPLDAVA